jgi:hypothetical protein
MKKLRAVSARAMLAIIRCRIFCLPVCYPKYKYQDTQKYNVLLLLNGREAWSLILREEHSLRVFENRVLRSIFGPKWDEVRRKRRRLHNEELNDLYSTPNITRVIKSRRMR